MATIIGNRILSGTAPVASDVPQNNLQGYQWQNGTSLSEWNPGTSQWIAVGNLSNAGYGLLSKAGGAVTGAITGPSGLAPIDSPNFTTAAKRDSVDLATVNDLADLETKINTSIDSKIASAISTSTSSIAISNNIKVTRGYIQANPDTEVSIPQPAWADGSPIPWANSTWIAHPAGIGGNVTDGNPDHIDGGGNYAHPSIWKVVRTSENPAKIKVTNRQPGPINVGTAIEYLIVSVRAGS